MRDFIDFVKNIVKDGDKKIDKEYVRNEEVDRHRDRCDPTAGDALMVADTEPALRVDVRREHFPVQHEVRLKEHLQIITGQLNHTNTKTNK